jgi:hypothetical protein
MLPNIASAEVPTALQTAATLKLPPIGLGEFFHLLFIRYSFSPRLALITYNLFDTSMNRCMGMGRFSVLGLQPKTR